MNGRSTVTVVGLGAIAALLLDLDVPTDLGNAFFMMARLPGLIAHIREERTRERPMRVINSNEHSYDGTDYSE